MLMRLQVGFARLFAVSRALSRSIALSKAVCAVLFPSLACFSFLSVVANKIKNTLRARTQQNWFTARNNTQPRAREGKERASIAHNGGFYLRVRVRESCILPCTDATTTTTTTNIRGGGEGLRAVRRAHFPEAESA